MSDFKKGDRVTASTCGIGTVVEPCLKVKFDAGGTMYMDVKDCDHYVAPVSEFERLARMLERGNLIGCVQQEMAKSLREAAKKAGVL